MGPLVQVLVMTMMTWKAIWAIDFEFHALPGERPRPICLSALELISGRWERVWLWDQKVPMLPFTIDDQVLVIAYFATAEVGCFEALGWPPPPNLIDLFAEHRCETNGRMIEDADARKRNLLSALRYHGIPHDVDALEKKSMRDLAIRGGPFTAPEASALMAYCDSDVEALARLWPAMEPRIELARALFRGRFVASVARMEHLGVPVDSQRHLLLVDRWDQARSRVAYLASAWYERVYCGTSFVEERFERYLARRNISWPRLASGRLKMDDDTWADMARIHPGLAQLREARKTLKMTSLQEHDARGCLRPKFGVGTDGRNRAILGPFGSKTGRTQPRTSRFILANAKWLRGGLIRPEPGMALAYVDWSSAELGIMAALSNDAAMRAAYETGDPYLHFAKLAGRVPTDGMRADHEAERSKFKVVTLAVGYGQTARSLGAALGIQPAYAQEMLDLHRRTFPTFWAWSDAVSATAHGRRMLRTRLGWPLHVSPWSENDRSLRNFPVQATGAEILRVATVLAHDRGIRVLATLHDAFLIEAREEQIDNEIRRLQHAMSDASRLFLGDLELITEVHGPIRFPERFEVTDTWREVMELLGVDP